MPQLAYERIFVIDSKMVKSMANYSDLKTDLNRPVVGPFKTENAAKAFILWGHDKDKMSTLKDVEEVAKRHEREIYMLWLARNAN